MFVYQQTSILRCSLALRVRAPSPQNQPFPEPEAIWSPPCWAPYHTAGAMPPPPGWPSSCSLLAPLPRRNRAPPPLTCPPGTPRAPSCCGVCAHMEPPTKRPPTPKEEVAAEEAEGPPAGPPGPVDTNGRANGLPPGAANAAEALALLLAPPFPNRAPWLATPGPPNTGPMAPPPSAMTPPPPRCCCACWPCCWL